jgi:hypothetical protein
MARNESLFCQMERKKGATPLWMLLPVVFRMIKALRGL